MFQKAQKLHFGRSDEMHRDAKGRRGREQSLLCQPAGREQSKVILEGTVTLRDLKLGRDGVKPPESSGVMGHCHHCQQSTISP